MENIITAFIGDIAPSGSLSIREVSSAATTIIASTRSPACARPFGAKKARHIGPAIEPKKQQSSAKPIRP